MATFTELVNSGKLVLADFFAEWCGPCKTMVPVLKELKAKAGNEVTVLKIDVDRNPGLASHYRIQGVPTLILFRNGRVKWRQSGVVPVTQLFTIIQQYA